MPVETFQFTDGAMLAGDGSAQWVQWRDLAEVGWAVVEWDEANQRLRGLLGTVPPILPQNSAVAEHWAMCRAAGHSHYSKHLGDCAMVITAGNGTWTAATAPGNQWAEYW